MSRRPIPRAAIALAAIAGLLTAALAAAPTASASTIYACVKKEGGTARFVSQKEKCRKSEFRLSWNTRGLNGKNGANGANGAPGAAGAPGKEGAAGKEGKEGAAGKNVPTVLATGESERGFYAVWGIGGGYLGTSVTFQVPLKAALDSTHVHFVKEGTPPSAACPGTPALPTAASGNLCVYETSSGASTLGAIFPQSTGVGSGADVNGFGMYFTASGTSGAWNYGSWAVTG